MHPIMSGRYRDPYVDGIIEILLLKTSMDSPHNEPRPGGIPVIGRLTVMELLGFVGCISSVAVGAFGCLYLAPLLRDIWAPGSGGGAQMIMAMVFIPVVLGCIAMIISGSIGFLALQRSYKARIEGRLPAPLQNSSSADIGTIRTWMNILTATLIIQIGCLFLMTSTPPINYINALVTVCANLVFLIYLGKLAARLGKYWPVWVILTFLTSVAGSIIAYSMIRTAVKETIPEFDS